MRTKIAIVAAALLALTTPALAQSQPKHHHRAHASHAKRHPPKPPATSAWPSAGPSRHCEATCPNGDCQGLNSPNGFGGGCSDF